MKGCQTHTRYAVFVLCVTHGCSEAFLVMPLFRFGVPHLHFLGSVKPCDCDVIGLS